jgi:hypothetical protein
MTYRGRALYNLLQMNLKRNPHLEVELWQVEDYRTLSTEELFDRLKTYHIFLDQNHLDAYIEETDSPEDLAAVLDLGQDYMMQEKIFLTLFELWRRFCPHKYSLSLFCDELDHLIEEYEDGNSAHEEEMQASLLSLQKILDDHVDEGGDAEEGFEMLSHYSCHDIETFIYEYSAHQLDLERELYASELLEGFYPYMQNKRWFELLRVRVVLAANLEEGRVMLARLLDSLKENPDLHLLFETLHFLVYLGDGETFFSSFKLALNELKTEEDLLELMQILCDYFEWSNRDREKDIVHQLIEARKSRDLSSAISQDDRILQVLKEMIIALPASEV